MVKMGSYFLVSDHNSKMDALQTLKEVKAPNFHKVRNRAPVYASGTPTVDGLRTIMRKFHGDGHKDVFVFNLRQEPVLFLTTDDGDFCPFSLREQDKLRRLFLVNFSQLQADEHEAHIRKEVLDLAALSDDKVFYVYSEPTTPGSEYIMEHQQKVLTVEDQLLTATEVFARNSFGKRHIRCCRLNFPQNKAPAEAAVDAFLAPFKENPHFLSPTVADFPALYVICGTGKGRSTLGKAMGLLLYLHKMGFQDRHNTAGSGGRAMDNARTGKFSPLGSSFDREEPQRGHLAGLRAVQLLLQELDNRWDIKREVDIVIDQCSTLTSLGSCVLDAKAKLDSFPISNNIEADHFRDHLYQMCLDHTERYLFLIVFNAYLHDQFGQGLCLSYKQWLQRHPGIVYIMANLSMSKRTEPASLLSSGRRCLVSDSYIGLDVLSSKMDVKVANFRRQMGLPIYGMAQPARDGLSRVVSFLLHKKQGYGEVVVVNLRNDLVIEFDESTYHVQDVGHRGEPVSVYGATAKELEVSEEALLKEIKERKTITVYEELHEPTVTKTPSSLLTADDLWQQQRLQTLDMFYYRLPALYDHSFQEKEFDAIQQLLFNHLKTEGSWREDQKAFVFHCRTGKSRTSLAMAIASIVFYHMRGFPYGAKPGEQELVSCPNRSYTLGEFEVVMRLVRLLPDGYQRKREVDFVLDRLFETMSPMHFHIREVIFVTYNKVKSSPTESVRQRRRRQSLDFLERYIYLILYTTYVAEEKANNFSMTFSKWMQEVAAEAGVYEVLDNLDFRGLDSQPFVHYRSRQQRWTARYPDVPFYGMYV